MLTTLFLLLLTPAPAPQSVGGEYPTHHSWEGTYSEHDWFGRSVAGAGDVDADGVPDLIVGGNGNTHANPLSYPGEVTVYSGATGQQLYQFTGLNNMDLLGFKVCGVGDVNADGHADFAITSVNDGPGFDSDSGTVSIISGADGSRLYRWDGTVASEWFGSSLSGGEDFNLDGYDDIVIGAPGAGGTGAISAGAVMVYSGADGSLLHQWDGRKAQVVLGVSAAFAGDVNADGYIDIIAGAPNSTPGGVHNAGSAYVYSGATGDVLYRKNGVDIDDRMGASVSGAGDVNRDGFDDFVIGAPQEDIYGPMIGMAMVYSGKDGSLLYKWIGEWGYRLGKAVSEAGDFNGDGYDDILIGNEDADFGGIYQPGVVTVYSGASGLPLHIFHGQSQLDRLGVCVDSVGDLNGDGLSEIIAGAPYVQHGAYSMVGSVYVFGMRPYLIPSDIKLSHTTGGVIDYRLEFPSAAAGKDYKILVSRSGIGPTFYGVDIPLTQDYLVNWSWAGIGNPHPSGMHGALDSSAKGSATISLAQGQWASLIGIPHHLAAVALDSQGIPIYSSVAVPLTVTP